MPVWDVRLTEAVPVQAILLHKLFDGNGAVITGIAFEKTGHRNVGGQSGIIAPLCRIHKVYSRVRGEYSVFPAAYQAF